MAKAGWCMDGVQYLHLDMPEEAARLHRKCKGKQCDCDCGTHTRAEEAQHEQEADQGLTDH